jgi:hypothetical protein
MMILRVLIVSLMLLAIISSGIAEGKDKGEAVSYRQAMKGLESYFPQMQEAKGPGRYFGKTKDGFVMFDISCARDEVEYFQLYVYTREPANTPRVLKRNDEIRKTILSNIFADQGQEIFDWLVSATAEIAASPEGQSRKKEIDGKMIVISVNRTGLAVLTVTLR